MTFLYVEGDTNLGPGFRRLFGGYRGLKVIPCGSNSETEKRWRREQVDKPHHRHWLLIDRDEPEKQAAEDRFFMVQLMESWFLADREKMAEYFGAGFNQSALPKRPVEEIAAVDVLESIMRAVKGTRKRKYHKVKHGVDLLMRIRIDVVAENASSCQRLRRSLEQL